MSFRKSIICLVLAFVFLCSGMYVSADEMPRSDAMSQGQENIVKRARQMIELEWTPLADITQWGYRGTFTAGTTYKGAPYGQPVYTGYIGYKVNMDEFMAAVEDNTSVFYTSYSYYSRIAPYYSVDCSGVVSYAWQLNPRCHTGTLPGEGVLIGNDINSIQIADCLNNGYSHAALVTDVKRWSDGTIASIEIMEGNPVTAQSIRYGFGGEHSIEYFIRYYFGSYKIYRNPDIDTVTYTHYCAVPIDGDYCANCREKAPYAYTEAGENGKKVYITHKKPGVVIYYTTDGTEPTTSSKVYSGPFEVTTTTVIKAKAISSDFADGRVLTYCVEFEQAATPTITQTSGMANGSAVSYGSEFSITCATSGAQIYYTLDGSEPNLESDVYTSPIFVTEGMTIRAMAAGGGCKPGEQASLTFTIGKFNPFTDVPETQWYYKAVEYAYTRKLFSGTTDTTFSPDTNMTRGMFLTVLARTAGIRGASGEYALVTGSGVNIRTGPGTQHEVLTRAYKYALVEVLGFTDGWYKVRFGDVEGYMIDDYVKSYDGRFTDLDTTKYYSAPIQWAALSGIVPESGEFRAEEEITREDMAFYLYNYVNALGYTLKNVAEKTPFADDSEISAEKSAAVYALQQAKVISGMGDNLYSPHASATRAQVAQIFRAFTSAVK